LLTARNSPPDHVSRQLLPDFLVIAPAKTGSTWLAANLNCHPEIHMSPMKEMHFFNLFMDHKSWDWYAEFFRPGMGLCKGEATPGYCDLPSETLRLIRSIMPRVKLIYLLRDPVARAWSHAKHCFRHRTHDFVNTDMAISDISDAQWLNNVADYSSMRSGQYLQHLSKWLSVFPREQLHVEFFDAIKTHATALLDRVFQFLGVQRLDDYSSFLVSNRLNEGLHHRMSPWLRQRVRAMYAHSVRELKQFLQAELGLALPPSWVHDGDAAEASPGVASQRTEAVMPVRLPADGQPTLGVPALGAFRKRYIRSKLAPRIQTTDYYGFNIVLFKECYLAVSRRLGSVDLTTWSASDIERFERKGLVFRASGLEAVKAKVVASHLQQLSRRAAAKRSQRRAA